MKILDYGESHCRPCGAWCCKDEVPFVGEKESLNLGVKSITTQDSGDCQFLKNSLCSVYNLRPFECRIFPFDIIFINNELQWILWEVCPAHSILSSEDYVNLYERDLLPHLEIDYLKRYARYHEKHQPKKYSETRFKIIRPVREIDSLCRKD